MKILIVIIVVLASFQVSAQAIENPNPGKQLFEKHCSKCHGKTGVKGFFGAKNLQVSKLDDQALFQIISAGKRIMPSWKKRLSNEQILTVVAYIKTLRKI